MAETAGEKEQPLAIRQMPESAKLLLRGRSANSRFVGSVRALTGLAVPTVPNSAAGRHPTLLWLSPTGWLLLGWPGELTALEQAFRQRLEDRDGDAIDVSDEYAHVRLSGAATGDLLAAVSPLDMSDAAFPPASVSRTLVAGIGAIVHRPGVKPVRDLYVDRSHLPYLIGALEAQAHEFRAE